MQIFGLNVLIIFKCERYPKFVYEQHSEKQKNRNGVSIIKNDKKCVQ